MAGCRRDRKPRPAARVSQKPSAGAGVPFRDARRASLIKLPLGEMGSATAEAQPTVADEYDPPIEPCHSYGPDEAVTSDV